MERKVKHLGGIITLLISVLFASCSPEDSILEAIHLKNTEFLESNDDYMILESTVIIYNTENAYNNLANEEIRYKAFHYAENSDLAQMYRDKARRLRNSTKLDSDYNPNWYEEAKRADKNDHEYDSFAENNKIEFENALKDMTTESPVGGFWVYHEIEYKEYITTFYAGPYLIRYIYLFSDDGKNILWSDDLRLSNNGFRKILDATHTQYEVAYDSRMMK